MYKKILFCLTNFRIVAIVVLLSGFYCYSAEHQLLENPTRIALPQSIIDFPGIIQKLPEEVKKATLEVLKSTTTVTAALMKSTRQICDEDSQKLLTRVENSTENISKIISKEIQKTLNDVINISVLKGIFALAVYQGYTVWNNNNPAGLWYMVFGLVGFLYVQTILDKFEIINSSVINYIQCNATKEKLHKLISRYIGKTHKNKNLNKFNERVASLERKLQGDDNDLLPLGPKKIKTNLEKFNESIASFKKNKLQGDDNNLPSLGAIHFSSANNEAEEKYSNPEIDQILNSALDEFDQQ